MKTIRKSFLLGLTALSLGTASLTGFAQQGPMDHPMGHHEMDPAKHAERMAKHQAALHDKLKLTAAQEPAWKTFVAAMAPTQQANRQNREEMRAQMEKMTAPERMEKMISRMKEHEAQMTTKLQALKTFYAVLTPEQQKIFDANFGPGHREHGGGHHGNMQRGQQGQAGSGAAK